MNVRELRIQIDNIRNELSEIANKAMEKGEDLYINSDYIRLTDELRNLEEKLDKVIDPTVKEKIDNLKSRISEREQELQNSSNSDIYSDSEYLNLINELRDLEEKLENTVIPNEKEDKTEQDEEGLENISNIEKTGLPVVTEDKIPVLVEPKKLEVVASKKSKINKWKKSLLIAGGLVALGLIAYHFAIPTLMLSNSTLWHSIPALQGVFHGINQVLGTVIGATYTSGTGIWTVAGAALNAEAANLSLLGAVTRIGVVAGGTGLLTAKAVSKIKEKLNSNNKSNEIENNQNNSKESNKKIGFVSRIKQKMNKKVRNEDSNVVVDNNIVNEGNRILNFIKGKAKLVKDKMENKNVENGNDEDKISENVEKLSSCLNDIVYKTNLGLSEEELIERLEEYKKGQSFEEIKSFSSVSNLTEEEYQSYCNVIDRIIVDLKKKIEERENEKSNSFEFKPVDTIAVLAKEDHEKKKGGR